jgi:hypothetical protein
MGGKGTFAPGTGRNATAVAAFDGVWHVRRVGGLLPPLWGMRKRIDGARGETQLGPLRMSFDVRGDELHYHSPFKGLVDVLTPVDGGHVDGRATFRGRELGRFELRKDGRPRGLGGR